uniref:TERF1 (TRF1)-interacting nuclear factor 2 n=1 Tax=Oreochromis niloticus TaxID=8128 RepID=A0A669DIG7_ORENI
MWKVLKQRDVMQYGVVEEFVTSACEAVPGLLTVRHQGRLTVGLRARVSITGEGKSDLNVCLNHLSDLTDHSKDVKLMRTVRDFHSLIHTFLTDPAIREKFYKEVFPVDYGATFDQELEKLLWEFLVRLDQLLPVPNLVQTVAWLSDAPPVLEECAQAATQPQLLKILLQHETCLGHLESAASLPPNMGDSILASLSLPPSGRVPSDQPTAARKLSVDESEGSEPKSKPSFIAPVIGLISNEDVPVLNAGIKRTQRSDGPADNAGHEQLNSKFTSVKQRQKAKDKGAKEGREQLEEEEGCTRSQRSGVKRKNSDRGESDLEEEEVLSLGVKTLYHPEDQHLYSVFVDCLSMEPRVVIEEMSTASLSASTSGTEETSSYKAQNKQRRKSPATASTQRQTSSPLSSDTESPGLQDKDVLNCLCLPQLFMKRYYKTKHGTYVPTLREFWKPAMTRRRLLSAGHKRR